MSQSLQAIIISRTPKGLCFGDSVSVGSQISHADAKEVNFIRDDANKHG